MACAAVHLRLYLANSMTIYLLINMIIFIMS